MNDRRQNESISAMDSLEKMLRIATILPQAFCAMITMIVVMSYLIKAFILSDRNDDSYWWHFGELKFYALDEDWWSSCMISLSIVLGVAVLLILCWMVNFYCMVRISNKQSTIEMNKLETYASLVQAYRPFQPMNTESITIIE